MTIAAGFVCSDGILVTSDTLYSGAMQNAHGEKLWVLHDNDPVVVFGGSAQSVAALTRARDEVRRKLRGGLSFQKTLDLIDDALKKVDQKFPIAPGYVDVQALVVIRAEGRNVLYQNAPTKVALSPVDAPFACVGVDALGGYFAEFLFKPGMDIKWARFVAAHLVANCKTYASGYCGGETRMIEIPNDGPVVKISDQGQIRAYEAYLAGLDRAYAAVLPDGTASEETLTYRVAQIAKAIRDAERGFAIEVQAGRLTLTGHAPSLTITDTPLPLRDAPEPKAEDQ